MKNNFKKDCYIANPGLYARYRSYQTKPLEVIDFNSASLARPYVETFRAVNSGSKVSAGLDSEARKKAAAIVGISDPNQVLFGRNTTEAMSFVYWLANTEQGNVVTTDAENESIPRIFREHRDHGNTDKSDGWSTFADPEIAERYEGLRIRSKTKTKVKVAKFSDSYNIDKIVESVDQNTCLVVVSHITRTDGRIVDIKELARRVKQKNPNAYIAIDGAQALGNLPRIDFSDLEKAGIDFYVATPHKTLGSYPLGILYVSDRAKSQIPRLQGKKTIEQVVMRGMIPDIYQIRPNVSESLNPLRYRSLTASLDKLEKEGFLHQNDFSRKSKYVATLKDYFVQRLNERGLSVECSGTDYSPAIVSFNVPRMENGELVRRLQEQGIFCSYISSAKRIRASFDITNTKEEIDRYFKAIDTLRSK